MRLALVCLLLAGCHVGVTNDQIIAEHAKCRAASMETYVAWQGDFNPLTYGPVGVYCIEEKHE
jgi:hypothetical protein